MQKSKIYGKLISFIPVRRGNWVIKASVFKDKYVLLVMVNSSTAEFCTRHFDNQHEAVDWIDMVVSTGNAGSAEQQDEE